MRESKLYRVVTFQDVIAGLPNDYIIFMLIVGVGFGFFVGFVSGNEYIGVGALMVLDTILYVIGLIYAHRDPDFFNVIVTNLFKISSSNHYEP